MRKTFAITDEDGKRWLLDTKGTPIRDTVVGEWVDSKAISFDYLPDLPPIFREMFYFYAGEQRWEDDEDYEEINSCIYYSITGYADLPKEGEIIEIDVTLVSPSQQLESKKYIKTRKHK
jgi:hypothetical protein